MYKKLLFRMKHVKLFEQFANMIQIKYIGDYVSAQSLETNSKFMNMIKKDVAKILTKGKLAVQSGENGITIRTY